MTRPAFLVDGRMEQIFFQNICPGSPVRLINCNGRDVEISTIARFVDAHLNFLLNRYFPIVVIFDRESRDLSADDARADLKQALLDRGHPEDQLVIGCADRMIENWLLGDPELLTRYNGGVRIEYTDVDGFHGTSELVRALGHNRQYHKTTTGVELLLAARASEISRRSHSFASLCTSLNLPCDWLRR